MQSKRKGQRDPIGFSNLLIYFTRRINNAPIIGQNIWLNDDIKTNHRDYSYNDATGENPESVKKMQRCSSIRHLVRP